MNLNDKLAKKLKEARIQAGHRTAKIFAQKNNIPYTTYAQHESGKRALSAKIILKYSKILKVKPDFILQLDKNETGVALIDKMLFLQITNNIINHHKVMKKPMSTLKILDIAVSVYNYRGHKKSM